MEGLDRKILFLLGGSNLKKDGLNSIVMALIQVQLICQGMEVSFETAMVTI
jgi:aryl carrier-like protein